VRVGVRLSLLQLIVRCSYGGKYGPTFAHHFLAQNAAIAGEKLDSIPLNLKTLGIGNGLTVCGTRFSVLRINRGPGSAHSIPWPYLIRREQPVSSARQLLCHRTRERVVERPRDGMQSSRQSYCLFTPFRTKLTHFS
jgi:hypothetical protein